MDKNQLNALADQIEAVLVSHGAPARVTGGNVYSYWIQFVVQPSPDVGSREVENLSGEIAAALGVETVSVSAPHGVVMIDVQRAGEAASRARRLAAQERAEIENKVRALVAEFRPSRETA